MLNSNNGNNEQQELLDRALFSYIGYHHVQNLAQDLDSNREEINKINLPKSLDKWFYKFNNSIVSSKRNSKYSSTIKKGISKAAIIFLIIAISVAVLTVSVDAFRVRVFNLIIENTEKYLGIKIEEEGQGKDNLFEDIKGYYIPGYIPEGFEMDTIENPGDIVIITYKNQNNNYLKFNQSSNESSFQLDSEDAVIEEVNINGIEGITIAKEDFIILYWNDKESSFYILSNIELEELIKMAKSLELKK